MTSRIGRKQDRPGLVFTCMEQESLRDRSHYEKFRSYHQKVYSFVEPDVTPFSIPAIERSLHTLLVTYIRHNTELTAGAQSPSPIPFQLRPNLQEDFEKLLLERVEQSIRIRRNICDSKSISALMSGSVGGIAVMEHIQ